MAEAEQIKSLTVEVNQLKIEKEKLEKHYQGLLDLRETQLQSARKTANYLEWALYGHLLKKRTETIENASQALKKEVEEQMKKEIVRGDLLIADLKRTIAYSQDLVKHFELVVKTHGACW
jgi:hemerythrin-like domain-containing protein